MDITGLVLAPIITSGAFLGHQPIDNLTYLGNRYINHGTARFITQDDYKQYYSHYNYGSGNVIASSDPTGNMFMPGFDLDKLIDEQTTSDDELMAQREPEDLLISENKKKVKAKRRGANVTNIKNAIMASNDEVGILLKKDNQDDYYKSKARELISLDKSMNITVTQQVEKQLHGARIQTYDLHELIKNSKYYNNMEYKRVVAAVKGNTATIEDIIEHKKFRDTLHYVDKSTKTEIQKISRHSGRSYSDILDTLVDHYMKW
ncbi:hypothetical protein BJAS_P3463 [Bathymodiolus japonicus methanotrophic gill symbiont]|uniref:hypothetical protein n=1 Tax=Bathymodiolus japonicus methanotrophic gill symbiont TaxID=113269 RepID=UPI001B5E2E67|nr:hypothetical protein [Bathymodiolus japonicus methanotrophic gill symbiont]GFO72926.1 hypothetical protein BJAS_P3463 [Bathymodiolus japonicus methanotrophic gill symbiont]